MIKDKQKQVLLDNLRKLPIVQAACQKSGVSRATYYRWRGDSKKFAKEADEAIQEGVEIVNDMSEHQLIKAIKEENFSAIRFWLQNRHKAYGNKLEVLKRGTSDNQDLTKEQRKVVREALRLASAQMKENDKAQPPRSTSSKAGQR